MAVSTFDLFKIGIGPSSSHTVGPMRAARSFAHALANHAELQSVHRVRVELYGSLGATGKGHGSDKAVLLGLCGHEPDSVEVDAIVGYLERIRATKRLELLGRHAISFDEKRELIFNRRESLPLHPNGMRFTAFDAHEGELLQRTYYSVGGGFIVCDSVAADGASQKRVAPDTSILEYPFHSGSDLLAHCDREQRRSRRS